MFGNIDVFDLKTGAPTTPVSWPSKSESEQEDSDEGEHG
jgi:hypothetical protein